ncbi:MAG: radical SAM protein, partial [Desulfohalobiaceae bacterium]
SRLGRSLGIDLLGAKICDFDCLYCEVGPTRVHTMERSPYVPAATVLAELEHWLGRDHLAPDHITLGGMGEPCLNSEIDVVITGIRDLAPGVPIAVLTNSSLLHDPDVVHALQRCDVVLPSMDTLVQKELEQLNRPCTPLSASDMAADLLAFSTGYTGKIFLEILLVRGINDTGQNQALLRDFCRRLAPERIDVVTMSRPGAYPAARAVSRETLRDWQQALGAHSPMPGAVRTDAEYRHEASGEDLPSLVLSSLRRRPQRMDQLSTGLDTSQGSIGAALSHLVRQGAVRESIRDGQTFYMISDQLRPPADTP